VELTTRQINLLLASLEGSMIRMAPGCPMHGEIDELWETLFAEVMERELS
jgi:hypothetical protein